MCVSLSAPAPVRSPHLGYSSWLLSCSVAPGCLVSKGRVRGSKKGIVYWKELGRKQGQGIPYGSQDRVLVEFRGPEGSDFGTYSWWAGTKHTLACPSSWLVLLSSTILWSVEEPAPLGILLATGRELSATDLLSYRNFNLLVSSLSRDQRRRLPSGDSVWSSHFRPAEESRMEMLFVFPDTT